MQIIEKGTAGLKREFNVVVAAAAIEERMTVRLNEVGQQVRLPGFRPGKVPMALLKKRFGSSVMGEVLERTIDETLRAAITEKSLKPAMQPKVEVVEFGEGKDLEIAVKLEVLPDIQSADFAAMALEKWVAPVSEAEVDEALENIRKASRTTKIVEENRKAATGDVVVADYEGSIDGKPFEGGSGKRAMIEIGAGRYVPGFEDQLIGAMANDTVNVKVTFPADYGNAELAGKNADFKVRVYELRTIEVPALDDALAQRLGEANLDALRTATRNAVQRNHDQLTRMRLKRQLLDKLAGGHAFDVPQGMVDAEFDAIWKQIEQAKADNQLDPEDAGKSDDELRTEYRSIAERRVRLGLLLSDVGQKNNIQVTPEELSKAAVAEARRFPGQEQVVLNYYRNNPQALEGLKAPVFEDKVVDFIIELAKVSTKTVTLDELKADPEVTSK
ncbi:MAG: trigger factor [Rhodospirillaceae bacterium]|nr:trigger factor [Rhodospirillaceae bacterium]